ncbi:MAG: DJ-1/PfpI family protein [Candidatus Sericytochromatia bacterium]
MNTKKIGVLIEMGFDVNEFTKFNLVFPQHQYQVEYLSDLWGHPSLIFRGNDYAMEVTVKVDLKDVEPVDYDGIILIGGYAMDRLRYQEKLIINQPNAPNQAPAVKFLRKAVKAMNQKQLVIGAIDHSLWLFCAAPELLRGRLVTCAHNILCDVVNAGGHVVFDGHHLRDVMTDEGLVTGRHSGVVNSFMDACLEAMYLQRQTHWHAPTSAEVATYLDTLERLHSHS